MNFNLSEVIKEDTAYISWVRQLTSSTIFICCTIILPIGIALNFIEIIIFQREKFTKSTMGFYLSINSALHTIILIYVTVFNLPTLYRINLITMSDLTCKSYYFFLRSLFQIYSWLNVLIVADRLLFIVYPNRFKFQKKKHKIGIFLFFIMIFSFACNIPNLFYFVSVRINNSTNMTRISKSCTAVPLILTIRGIMTILFRTVLPFVLMLLLNNILIYKVLKSKEKMRRKKKLIHDLKFSFTVIVSTIIFLITLVPNSVYVFMAFVFQIDNTIKRKQTYSSFLFIFEIMTSIVYYLYYSFNFFIQLAFNSIFRKEFIKALEPYLKKLKTHFQNEGQTKSKSRTID